ncbi:NAD(P)-dependent oxidoreductase [Paractinoplanes brasiliensis]|uniref:D-3-phosphoglycerate dehydrogenase/(S)-sulfolactate dehydrogenase n=1 Tax=Paractinoplanes brasiliensis TaxID=52695 RepID=A0A4R6J877_9ACTN|nr:NAD(P)-dependent oxidoreductase [Actinoplanes brasiliensis]TDO31784.1 D-3-phosphoglycerate dehydrogenase/(S)-sulfolactate dehydrogenase [Actinoplanes brasiliensis]GID30619.1 3-phosphoglycerate dehydrogenase [Actinoplanes brasiliensis]
MPTVLITTDYLSPGDEVDTYLTGLGFATRHSPLRGSRTAAELVSLLDGVDGALIANEPMSADVLAAAPALRAIVRTGVGYDSVDVAAAARLGISVSNLPGINANAVAEYTIALMLAQARDLVGLAAGVAAGAWPRRDGFELRGKTLGIIGRGAVAQRVRPLAEAFGMTVLDGDLDNLLRESDFVSVHTALTERTRHLIDASALARMKPSAHLINTARGPIVDSAALVDAVRSGRIAGAALDVVDVEPLPAGSPLRGVDGITVYSHMAGQTAEARRDAGVLGARELVAALDGRPQHRIAVLTPEEIA